eukprot:10174030-Ditylum_brightwellii.AAC.1
MIDTKVTVAQLREDLGDLPAYILAVNSDIRVFNQHVRIIKQGLICRGKVIDDLMVHVFRGYYRLEMPNFANVWSKRRRHGKKVHGVSNTNVRTFT